MSRDVGRHRVLASRRRVAVVGWGRRRCELDSLLPRSRPSDAPSSCPLSRLCRSSSFPSVVVRLRGTTVVRPCTMRRTWVTPGESQVCQTVELTL